MARPGSSRCRALSAVAVFGFFLAPIAPLPTPVDDGSLVFCLDHQTDLIRAAIALDRGTPAERPDQIRVGSQDLRVAEWRRSYPADFDRSCAALRAAGPADKVQTPADSTRPNPWFAPVTTLTATVVGALLTFLVTRSRDQVAQRRQEANELHSAVQAFESVVHRYAHGWLKEATDAPSAPQVIERTVDLQTKLRRVHLARPDWPEPTEVLARLDKEPLGRYLIDTEAWAALDPKRRVERGTRIFGSLANLTRDADHIAYRHDHPRHNKQPEQRPATPEIG
ncbi:hypothetical protein DFJ67_1859 [Asanoa ferruginea]|uniref:Uncharacterized protein n=1 Tax=Asanoa ferruginea TaxID=53367 RepID=A0A3D9ZEQ3_9ACTN|nr:hypothetical protein [Asanoa ferruginea]REF95896.1 hypothetical protein DFJ67_1859 [Asanoa ferruginea]GIF50731.1 hypothetical protein Afe04nite_52700 [Asanoa ferruginea]